MSVLSSVERSFWGLARHLLGRWRTTNDPPADHPPAHADERTIRHVGEAQLGGISSEESRAAYERGENPGGLHHRARRTPARGDGE
jgi:hypothetical protein